MRAIVAHPKSGKVPSSLEGELIDISKRIGGHLEPRPIPALFATIHFRSDERPDGYTDEEIARLNEELNKPTD